MGVAAPRTPVGSLGLQRATPSKVLSRVLVDWATRLSNSQVSQINEGEPTLPPNE